MPATFAQAFDSQRMERAQAACALIAIAMVHSDNRAAAAIAMGIFATGVAVCALLIASHDEPFTGEISVKPDVLLQVRPE
ncbi:MAG TPA: hypothetical protein VFH87_06735 [Candidatus Udaeobacter sp.]|nr:hypothetical protein [Candidatus Udaeobacter sp.]